MRSLLSILRSNGILVGISKEGSPDVTVQVARTKGIMHHKFVVKHERP